ncbi:hypothetical protein [Leptospira santarosai]|uniref:hypothetical protein n=1 Tax=Leptospira santarosai TaxID=28183 RepID=UPI001E40CFFC|nr:hypothetical protein [Leptospira santarosai]
MKNDLTKFIGWEISRPKGLGINHTGVIFGLDEFGQLLIIHNHPETNIAIVDLEIFLNGYSHYDLRSPSIPLQRIQRNIIRAIRENKKYDAMTNNCQHFSSFVIDGEKESKDLQAYTIAILLLSIGYFATRK